MAHRSSTLACGQFKQTSWCWVLLSGQVSKFQLLGVFFFCILFVFEFLQFLQVRKIHHKFLHAKNLHYTTLLHKENTTTLDYENKRKEKKASRIDINNKLVQLLFYQLKEGFPFVVMDLKFIILSGYKTFYLKRTLNSQYLLLQSSGPEKYEMMYD